MTIYLMVYRAGDVYYSTRFFKPGDGDLLLGDASQEVFTLEGDDPEQLEIDAKKEARQRGIAKVANLDD
jgi:hypothetical protein